MCPIKRTLGAPIDESLSSKAPFGVQNFRFLSLRLSLVFFDANFSHNSHLHHSSPSSSSPPSFYSPLFFRSLLVIIFHQIYLKFLICCVFQRCHFQGRLMAQTGRGKEEEEERAEQPSAVRGREKGLFFARKNEIVPPGLEWSPCRRIITLSLSSSSSPPRCFRVSVDVSRRRRRSHIFFLLRDQGSDLLQGLGHLDTPFSVPFKARSKCSGEDGPYPFMVHIIYLYQNNNNNISNTISNKRMKMS